MKTERFWTLIEDEEKFGYIATIHRAKNDFYSIVIRNVDNYISIEEIVKTEDEAREIINSFFKEKEEKEKEKQKAIEKNILNHECKKYKGGCRGSWGIV